MGKLFSALIAWIKGHIGGDVLIAFVLGALISGAICLGIGGGRAGQLDQLARTGQATITELTGINSELAASNKDLADRIGRLQAGIAEAGRLADGELNQTGDIIAKLQGVIDTLVRVKAKLASLKND